MAKEKLRLLNTEQLRKRKKIALILVWISIAVCILNVIVIVFLFVTGKSENISKLVPGFVIIVIAASMYVGIKKIDEELKNRENS